MVSQSWDQRAVWFVMRDSTFSDMSQAIQMLHQWLQIQVQQRQDGQGLAWILERALSKVTVSKKQLEWIQNTCGELSGGGTRLAV